MEKNKTKKKMLNVIKCPFVPWRPKNSFFSGNSSKTSMMVMSCLSSLHQTHNLGIVLFQYLTCLSNSTSKISIPDWFIFFNLTQETLFSVYHMNQVLHSSVFWKIINKFLDLSIVSKILQTNYNTFLKLYILKVNSIHLS